MKIQLLASVGINGIFAPKNSVLHVSEKTAADLLGSKRAILFVQDETRIEEPAKSQEPAKLKKNKRNKGND